MRWSHLLLATVGAAAFAPSLARADEAPDSSATVKEVVITAQRLDAARATIQPQTGASTYTIPSAAIQLLPGGDNVGLNTVVLQMPGVSQDSYGQLHVRDDHANIQFRFNGVILPEGLSFFGQVISPRIADQIQLVTGALPAEYGLRTAGVLNITTKSAFANGGQVGIYGGSHGEWEPSIQYGGSSGANSYFFSGSYLQDQLGIESVDGSNTPRHDRTTQLQGFGYFDHIIDQNSRVSFFVGLARQTFQIPDPIGLQPSAGFQFKGQTAFPSEHVNQNQREINNFAAVSYLYTNGDFSGQVSTYARYSSLRYTPDILGELLYNGFQQTARKETIALGFQMDGAFKLGTDHTIRAGFIFENDRSNSATTAQSFETDNNGVPLTDINGNNIAETIVDNGHANARTYSAYLQDEWKPIDAFVLNYGLRFDQLDSFREENQLSPRVNFVWKPFKGTTLHGGYSRYFTPPPFELVSNTTISKFVNTVAYPTVPLDTTPYSERENYFDFGAQQQIIKGLTVGADVYYRTSKHLIDEGQFGEAIILTPFNYHYGKIHGVEVTLAYDNGPFTSYFNGGYERALGKQIESSEYNFGTGCPSAPPFPDDPTCKLGYTQFHSIFLDHNETWTSSFGAAYRWRDTKFAIDGLYGSGLRATGASNIPNGVSVPTYMTFNLSVLQRIKFLPLGPFDARFDIVNLADKKYEIRDGTGVGVGAPQWGAGRGFFVGLTKLF